jgi:Tol biopolymer transport system component
LDEVQCVGAGLSTGQSTVLVKGKDFYSSPRINPDGSKLAWVMWDHPAMPWDDTELWVADIADDGQLTHHTMVCSTVALLLAVAS